MRNKSNNDEDSNDDADENENENKQYLRSLAKLEIPENPES